MPNPTQPFMPAAVFVALDLSRTSWVVALRTSGDDRVSSHKLRPGDVDRLLDLIERARAREEQRSGGPVEVRSCYEAGYDGFWLHRRLRAAGVRNVVVEPTSLLVDRRARRVKTDYVDGPMWTAHGGQVDDSPRMTWHSHLTIRLLLVRRRVARTATNTGTLFVPTVRVSHGA